MMIRTGRRPYDLNEITDIIDDINNTTIEGDFWSDDPDERRYRRRALIALGMDVVEEDVFQAMLSQMKHKCSNKKSNQVDSLHRTHATCSSRVSIAVFVCLSSSMTIGSASMTFS
jgi:hypothetical protein